MCNPLDTFYQAYTMQLYGEKYIDFVIRITNTNES